MKRLMIILCMLISNAHGDTINHYINIANNIPQMEMKADPEAQAWARSARNILNLTSESIIESLNLANINASRAGAPLFCPPRQLELTASQMNELIQKTYREISSRQSDKDRMTVSQVALIGLNKQFPCHNRLAHMPRIRIRQNT